MRHNYHLLSIWYQFKSIFALPSYSSLSLWSPIEWVFEHKYTNFETRNMITQIQIHIERWSYKYESFKIRKHARKYRSAGWSLFIKGAANSQRSAPAFTGKCRLVRRRGERQQVNAGNTQIRLKYEYKYTKYTRKDKKYTNTKIQTHTNTNFTVGSLSQIRRGEKRDFSEKVLSRKRR